MTDWRDEFPLNAAVKFHLDNTGFAWQAARVIGRDCQPSYPGFSVPCPLVIALEGTGEWIGIHAPGRISLREEEV